MNGETAVLQVTFPRVCIADRCPSCGHDTLFIGTGGWLTCSWLKCPEPGVSRAITAKLAEAREPLPDRYACQRCGRRDGLDTVVPDEIWARLSEAAGGINLLCLWCMDALAVRLGIQELPVGLFFSGQNLFGDCGEQHAVATSIAVRSAVAEARREERTRIADYFTHLRPEEIRLHAGEVPAQEMRTVIAVLRWQAGAIRACKTGPTEPTAG